MTGSDPASALDTPARIGALTVKNRWVMAAMGTAYAGSDGGVSERLIRYLARRARGGAGLVVTEATPVDASGAPFPGVLRADDDRFLDGLARLARAVRAEGAAVALQLYHAGRQMSERFAGRQPVAPSAIPCPFVRAMPRALAGGEVEALADRFADAAGRARVAGFDGVELNGGHGYLLHQFLSPLSNQRDDDWGGDPARRARFPVEVVRRIRARVGPGFPILYKISADEHLPGGLMLQDTIAIGRRLVEAGVDALVVSAGTYTSFEWIVQPAVFPRATLRASAAAFKQALGVPIVAVGRILDAATAAEIVRAGDADLVAVGRALLADPDLPAKAAAGRAGDVRPCIGCNECLRDLFGTRPVRCAVNPETGREDEGERLPAAAPTRAIVIGGGPAGMQAAIAARERGHEVTLLEAGTELGGALRLAARAPGGTDLARLVAWMAGRLRTLGVTVRLGVRADPDLLAAESPGVVIVATGAARALPAIPGVEAPHVRTVEQLLADGPDGERADRPEGAEAVVIGDDAPACQAAWLLQERGARVRLLATGEPAREIEGVTRRALLARLRERGVAVHESAQVERIEARAVHWVDAGGARHRSPVVAVVVSPAPEPDAALARRIEQAGWRVEAVGDCAAPGSILDAIHAAAAVAARI